MKPVPFHIGFHPIVLITIAIVVLLYPGTGFLPASEEAVSERFHDEQVQIQKTSKTVKQTVETVSTGLSLPTPPEPSDPLEEAAPELVLEAEAAREADDFVKAYTFKRGDSLSGALSKLGLSHLEIHEIARATKPVFDLRKIRAGQALKVKFQKNPLRFASLLYEFDTTQALKVERRGDQWLASKEALLLSRDIHRAAGSISSSLYAAAKAQGIPVEVILQLSDIFAWDIDFGIDIRIGDQFKVLYEVFKKEGRVVRAGRVLAAEIVNQGRRYPAYYFDPEGEGGDYYDQDGRSLKKAFLKSPLRYRYISSGYARRRLHPILKVNRPHLGIDFAAARGTPVRAASDGTVLFAGWKGGHGKTVIIRHKNGYKTLYGHLSSYWSGIKKGARVKQEDFIGRVGSTGLSTGPHLHYTLIKNGRAINPNKVALLRGEALAQEWFPLFSLQLERMNRILYSGQERIEGSGST